MKTYFISLMVYLLVTSGFGAVAALSAFENTKNNASYVRMVLCEEGHKEYCYE